ncbi:MAG TPA: CAAX prenyl protease-related protein, partial [Chthoniobacterales bacterium]
MNSVSNPPAQSKLAAYTVPMAVFIGALGLVSLLKMIGGAFWLSSPEYWVYPVQTLACAALLIWFWRRYDFHRLSGVLFTVAVALIVFGLWIAPQAFFGFPARTDGFNPETLAAQPAAYWATVLLRFLRLVIVVPLVEEIFWRGFLLRYFINEKFDQVPFGTFTGLSFAVVTAGFTFAHSSADWIAAAITGALYNLIAYRTKSLSSCV